MNKHEQLVQELIDQTLSGKITWDYLSPPVYSKIELIGLEKYSNILTEKVTDSLEKIAKPVLMDKKKSFAATVNGLYFLLAYENVNGGVYSLFIGTSEEKINRINVSIRLSSELATVVENTVSVDAVQVDELINHFLGED